MKKTILIILIFIHLVIYCDAQVNKTDFRDKFQFGLKAGLNYANVYDVKGEDFQSDPKFGLVTGVFMSIPIGMYIGIQPEILFSQKGFQATGRLLGSPYSFTRTTSFIDMPVLFAFKPSEFLTLVVGPQYSYLLKQRDVFENATTSIAQEQEFINDNIRKNILCFLGGFDLTLKHFVFGLRVGSDFQNNNGFGISTTPRYKNMWYQSTVGYRF